MRTGSKISIIRKLESLALWSSLWYILINILCSLGKNLYFAFLNVEMYKYKFGQCGSESILTDFCLAVLPKLVSWILKYPTMIVDLSVFHFELPIISL